MNAFVKLARRDEQDGHPKLKWWGPLYVRGEILNQPKISLCLVILLTVGWLYTVLQGGWILFPSYEVLLACGGIGHNEIAKGQYWRLLTSLFISSGLISYMIAIADLITTGVQLEMEFGGLNFILLSIIPGLMGNLVAASVVKVRCIYGFSKISSGMGGVVFADLFMSNGNINKVNAAIRVVLPIIITMGFFDHIDDNIQPELVAFGFGVIILICVRANTTSWLTWLALLLLCLCLVVIVSLLSILSMLDFQVIE